MRSVSTSACFISSNDSCRVYFASFVQPKFSCIFACRKYWLIAVSSPVSCSLRNSMTSGSPCIAEAPSDGGNWQIAPHDSTGDEDRPVSLHLVSKCRISLSCPGLERGGQVHCS